MAVGAATYSAGLGMTQVTSRDGDGYSLGRMHSSAVVVLPLNHHHAFAWMVHGGSTMASMALDDNPQYNMMKPECNRWLSASCNDENQDIPAEVPSMAGLSLPYYQHMLHCAAA